MGDITRSLDISASPEKIWETIANPLTWENWFTIHSGWMEEPPTALTSGTRLVEKILMLGMKNKLEWTVETVEAPGSLVVAGTGMAGVKTRFAFTLTPSGAATTVTIDGTFTGSMITGALGKAVEKDGDKQLGDSLARLAELVA